MTKSETAMAQQAEGALTPVEQTTLDECEATIDNGRRAFVVAGLALAEISNHRLYRATHKTFEDYCRERWNFSRSYASRLIGTAETFKMLPSGNISTPLVERHIRPLLQFAPKDRPKIWGKVLQQMPDDNDGKKIVTAAAVEKSIKALTASTTVTTNSDEGKDDEGGQTSGPRESKTFRPQADEQTLTDASLVCAAHEHNAVVYIGEALCGGEWCKWSDLIKQLYTPEVLARVWLNELKSTSDQDKRRGHLRNAIKTTDGMRLFMYQGQHTIVTTLAAMVWLGIVDQEGEGDEASYRLGRGKVPLCKRYAVDEQSEGTHTSEDTEKCEV